MIVDPSFLEVQLSLANIFFYQLGCSTDTLCLFVVVFFQTHESSLFGVKLTIYLHVVNVTSSENV